jgi:hypothetical protein
MDRTRTELIAFIVIQPLIFLCPPTKRRQPVVRIALSVRLSSELTKLALLLIKLHSRINNPSRKLQQNVTFCTWPSGSQNFSKILLKLNEIFTIFLNLIIYQHWTRLLYASLIRSSEPSSFLCNAWDLGGQGLQPIAIQDHDQLNFFWMQHGKSCLIDQWCNVRVGNLAGIPRRSKISTTWRLRWKFDLDRSISIRRIVADRATTSALWNKRGGTLDEITSTAICAVVQIGPVRKYRHGALELAIQVS